MKLKSFAFNPFSENTYIVFNENKNAFLVDPGNFQDFETEALEKFVKENDLTVKNILLTHAHIDHVLGLQWASDTYKVPVLMFEPEKEILDRNPLSAKQFGFFMKPFEGEIQYLKENEILKLDEDEFRIYHVRDILQDILLFITRKKILLFPVMFCSKEVLEEQICTKVITNNF